MIGSSSAKSTLFRRTNALSSALAVVALAACGPVSENEPATQERTVIEKAETPPEGPSEAEPVFHRSPGGTLEVAPEAVAAFLHAHGGPSARVVDVREAEELTGEYGHIAGVEHVPLGWLPEIAQSWDPEQPVVLVCRTGRRSSRGVEQLEAIGLRNVASMTGGMLHWKEHGLPVSRRFGDVRTVVPDEPPRKNVVVSVRGNPDAPALAIDPKEVRWIRTASLLSSGSQACVDGRDAHAVVGTPGGDAGELIVAVATAESLGVPPMDARGVEALVDDWIDAFGRFYLHSDAHALEHLRKAIVADARFAARGIAPANVDEMEALVRRPPHELEEALLELLVEPPNVGCGHLRAMLVDPEDYRVRPGLPAEVLRAVFRHLWRSPEDVDWVVLEGEHHETAVVVVTLDGEVHPYTKVPAIPPSIGGRQTFVAHPQVTAYLREENASFLLERTPALARRVGRSEFARRMRSIADTQLEATLGRLARGLPIYEARFESPDSAAAAPPAP